MKVTILVNFAIEFDSGDGKSKTNVTFALPEYPKLKITDSMKECAIKETRILCEAMLEREVFAEATSKNP